MFRSTASLLTVILLSGPPTAPTAPQFWIGQLGLERAWTISEGAGVTVGLVDTGVDAADPDLAGAVLSGAEFPDLGNGATDTQGHGTTIALLIVGQGRTMGSGTLGVAPRAKILPARLSGAANDADDAIRWVVDHGAKVINLSLGNISGHSEAYDPGLRYAQEHDVVIVAAAGNARTDRGVVSPADRPGVLAVSAVDKAGLFDANVSVEGSAVSIAAPGAEIATSRKGEMRPTSGTSQATAIVSGVVALIRAKFPDLTATETVDQLAKTAKDMGQPGRDPQYGFGLVDPVHALTTEPVQDTDPGWTIAWSVTGGLAAIAAATLFALRRTNKRPPP